MSSPFSCEELQDIDLELNLENSAFYDQFAITQVSPVKVQKVSLFIEVIRCKPRKDLGPRRLLHARK